jgi:hypothetical protein
MFDLQYFECRLIELIGRPTDLRLFVCDGSPLECRAFIVGFNPATASEKDFWTFWDPNTGFKKSEWLQNYIRERRQRPLKPGRTRRNTISSTRRVIDWIVSEASPLKILETNIYTAAPVREPTTSQLASV